MIIVMKTTLRHRREQRHGDAAEDLPLGRAVGARRLEHVARHRRQAGADHHHREAGPDPDVGDQERRRDQLRPEPRVAAERLRERRLADARPCSVPAGTSAEVERAVGGRSSCSARSCRRSTAARRSRRACRAPPVSTLPGFAAARLEVAPDDADDRRPASPPARPPASRRRHGGRRDRRQAELRDAARLQRRLQHEPVAGEPVSVGVDGSAFGSTPGELNRVDRDAPERR